MPKSDDRFYLMEMRNRPVLYGDIGSLVRLDGVLIGGGGASALLLLPGVENPTLRDQGFRAPNIYSLSLEEWSDWLLRTDDPEILVGPMPTGQTATLPKIWHRKMRYAISGAVQQKIWAADGFKCVYCGAKMGQALMTIDHFLPLELGGQNNEKNFLTACKKCNKDKGSEDPGSWCRRRNKDFDYYKNYLENRKVA